MPEGRKEGDHRCERASTNTRPYRRHILAAHPLEGCRREDGDVRSDNLIYILVVIILVLVALLLLSQLI